MEQLEKTSIPLSKQKAYWRAWYQRNRTKEIERSTKYHKEHPEARRETSRRWDRKHPEAHKERNRKWKRKHPEVTAKWWRNYYHRIQDEAGCHSDIGLFLRGYRIKKAFQDCKEIVEI